MGNASNAGHQNYALLKRKRQLMSIIISGFLLIIQFIHVQHYFLRVWPKMV